MEGYLLNGGSVLCRISCMHTFTYPHNLRVRSASIHIIHHVFSFKNITRQDRVGSFCSLACIVSRAVAAWVGGKAITVCGIGGAWLPRVQDNNLTGRHMRGLGPAFGVARTSDIG